MKKIVILGLGLMLIGSVAWAQTVQTIGPIRVESSGRAYPVDIRPQGKDAPYYGLVALNLYGNVGAYLRGRNNGVKGYASAGSGGTAYGTQGYAYSNTMAYGHHGYGNGSTGVGVYGDAYGTNFAIGVWGRANAPTSYAGYFEGNVALAGSHVVISDGRLKKGVRETKGTGVLDKVKKLRPVSFSWVDKPGMGLPRGQQYGLIAQEVKAVFPEVVADVKHITPPESDPNPDADPENPVKERGLVTEETFEGVKYDQLITILLQAVQDQQVQIEALQKEHRESRGGRS